ncbi:hypothetical protein [Micromonospora sp. CPCC 206061]|uniref:hypothetical protein n=1 Tax=Micromonospora sp. CPCC 206061 TaxID=3122410 RepID=UPI002FF29C13
MNDTQTPGRTPGAFVGDPAAALALTGSGGCCGNPPQTTTITLPDPVSAEASPCCGTQAEAQASGGCCGTVAKAEAVASGAGCCG